MCLLYPGRQHSFHGESESCKSLVIQGESSRSLTAGGRVLYVDFESDQASVVGRLRSLGATPAAILERFRYLRPETPLRSVADREAFAALLDERFDLAVIDGVSEALALLVPSTNTGTPEDRIAKYVGMLPRRIARRTGAAVVVVDHVTKSTDARGRYALGSQHKLNSLDGAAYTVEVVAPVGIGLRGVVELRVAKDRPGTVRPECGPFRKIDRTQLAARVIFDATGDGTVMTVEPPRGHVGDDLGGDAGGFRPTVLMERVSRYLEGRTEPVSGRVAEHVSGKGEAVRLALDVLVAEGYVRRTDGPKRAHLHTSSAAYRESDDPGSDAYEAGDALDLETDRQTDLSVSASCASLPIGGGTHRRTETAPLSESGDALGTHSGRTGTHS